MVNSWLGIEANYRSLRSRFRTHTYDRWPFEVFPYTSSHKGFQAILRYLPARENHE
jgi:hypothetical protein